MVDEDIDPERIDDDILALMFISCHPVHSPETRVALTLRVVGGLSAEQIARVFLISVPTVHRSYHRLPRFASGPDTVCGELLASPG